MQWLKSVQLSGRTLFVVSLVVLYFTLLGSVALGPMEISFSQSMRALVPSDWLDNALPANISLVIHQIRLPRALLAIAVGGILAQCGAVMQGLFRNPLADPGIIGVSSGASLGAALAIVLLSYFGDDVPASMFYLTVPVSAFIGGAVTTVVVYRLGTGENGTSVSMMLLAGVAIAALVGAGIGILNYIADDQALRDLSLWSMGSLAGAKWSGLGLMYITLVLLMLMFQRDADRLNALLLGEAEARHLGIDVQRLKRRLIMLTAAGVGVTVAYAGIIGFVGLIVPHLIRMLLGPNHRSLLPLSCLCGALLLLLADMVARTLAAPLEIPVGIITAFIGAPFFLWLLIMQRRNFS